MSLSDTGSNQSSTAFFSVNQNATKTCRLLIIPNDPDFGDLREEWCHTVNGLPEPGKARGQFMGYQRCISKSKNDQSCPMCRDRKRFPSNMRRACNVIDFTDGKVKLLIQGPKVWGQILEQLNAQTKSLNALAAQQGQAGTYTVFTAASVLDINISRDDNNQYTVSTTMNFQPVQFDRSMLIPLSSIEDFAEQPVDVLINIVQQANQMPQPTQQNYAAPAGGLAGGYAPSPTPVGVPNYAMPIAPGPGGINPPMSAMPTTPMPGAPPAMTFAPPMVGNAPVVAAPLAPSVGVVGMPPPVVIPPVGGMPTSGSPIMSLEDARSITCSMGKYQGQTLGEIADIDAKYLVTYLNTGNAKLADGVVKQAVAIVAGSIAQVFTDDNVAAIGGLAGGGDITEKIARITNAVTAGTLEWDVVGAALAQLGNGKTSINQLTPDEADMLIAGLAL